VAIPEEGDGGEAEQVTEVKLSREKGHCAGDGGTVDVDRVVGSAQVLELMDQEV
jgi:hypothetical protein